MGVDFAVSVFPRPEAFAGDRVRFKVKITNQGNEDFSDSDNPLEVQFLTKEPEAGSFSQVGKLKTVEELQAGRSTVVVSDSWTAAEGSNTIRVALDPENKIAEDSEAGNTRDVALLVPPASSRPELEVPDEEGADLPEAPVIILKVFNPTEDFSDFFDGVPKFVFHNWENLSDTIGIEMTDRPTRGGGTTGEHLRDFPEVLRFGVDVKQIPVPKRDQDAVHQDLDLRAQVDLARRLKGQEVEVTSSKHRVTMRGKVQEVTLSDSGEIDGTSTVQMTIREDPTVGEEAFDLGSLIAPIASEDPGGDDNQPDDVETLGPPKSLARAGPAACVRVPNATTTIIGALGDGAKAVIDQATEVDPATVASAGTAFLIPPDTMRALPGAVSKTAHAVGAGADVVGDAFDPRGIDQETGLQFATGDMKWISLGLTERKVSPRLSPDEREEVILKNRALTVISKADQFGLTEGEDYRFVGTGSARVLEVSAGFLVKHLDQTEPVRCD